MDDLSLILKSCEKNYPFSTFVDFLNYRALKQNAVTIDSENPNAPLLVGCDHSCDNEQFLIREQRQNSDGQVLSQNFHHLGEILAYWAKLLPNHKAYTILDANGVEEHFITYNEMYHQAVKIAQTLLSYGLQSQNVILLYPAGIEFIVAFFGCLYAGVVPAPIHPPKRNRSNQKIARLAIASQAKAILVPREQKQAYCQVLHKEDLWPENLDFIATDTFIDLPSDEKYELPEIDGSRLAFLQFTSGSTSLPKGVMITHDICLSNLQMSVSVSQATPDSTFVSWLPHHHDLGLVAHLLHSLYAGSHCVILSPSTFVHQPIQWLRAITQYQAQYTGAPNFAYQLCVDNISESEQQSLDLSSLRMAINAAEPISPQTLKDFSEKFADNGFKPSMFLPAYGMAEATVFISSGTLEQKPVVKTVDWLKLSQDHQVVEAINGAKEKILIGCGHAKLNEQICIVDPQRHCQVPPNHVGEIWVTGSNIMAGYYNNSEATDETLVSLEDDSHLYLRTGDLGFMDDQGELYITGRLKDMVIFNGVNYYPQDIEGCVEQAHPEIRTGCVAAFSVAGSRGEELVVFAELTKTGMRNLKKQTNYLEELVEAICVAVGDNLEIQLHHILFLKMGQLPKTSSGKLRRQQCKQEFQQGDLDILARWPQPELSLPSQPETDLSNVEKTFDQIMSMGLTHLTVFNQMMQMLTHQYDIHLAEFDLDKPIFLYGFDSLKLLEIHNQLEVWLNCSLPNETFAPANTFKKVIDEIVDTLSNEKNIFYAPQA